MTVGEYRCARVRDAGVCGREEKRDKERAAI